MGKSALMLETARYLRQRCAPPPHRPLHTACSHTACSPRLFTPSPRRYHFPHGIFCCSLEGVRSMKQVRY